MEGRLDYGTGDLVSVGWVPLGDIVFNFISFGRTASW